MNTAITTATPAADAFILALELGKYKSVACLYRSAALPRIAQKWQDREYGHLPNFAWLSFSANAWQSLAPRVPLVVQLAA
jgi:hypothetical protein